MPLIYNSDKAQACLNTYREVFSDPLKSGDDNSFTGNVILPLDFSLEMDGLSGIIPHSAFIIPTNTLPSSYIIQTGEEKGLSKIAFILHTIDQNFTNNKWTTKITGQTLNIRFEPLTEAEKAAIAAAKKAQNSLRAYQFVGTGGPPFSPKDKNIPVPPIKVTKELNTFEKATNAVIINLEGGYWNGGAISDPRYKDSKETMLGIDRGHKNSTSNEKKFWALVDANKKTWGYNHIPPDPLKTQLINAVIAIMKPDYEKLRNTYLDKEVIALVESDGRLFYNMVYAVWNGPAYFKGYSIILNNSYKRGYKTSEQLLDVFLKERIAGGGTAYTFGTGKNLGSSAKSLNNQGGLKIKSAVGL